MEKKVWNKEQTNRSFDKEEEGQECRKEETVTIAVLTWLLLFIVFLSARLQALVTDSCSVVEL